MITCKEVGPLIEQEEFEKLSFGKRIGMKFHMMMCKLCTGYKKESAHITDVVRLGKPEERKLTAEEKQQIKTAMDN